MKSGAEIKKAGPLKGILITEIVVCYMAALALLSHYRGPVQYRDAQQAPVLAQQQDFSALEGGAAVDAADGLALHNAEPGTAAGYAAQLPLEGLDGIRVRFSVNCPEQYANTGLTVDLYDEQSGYDDPAQESRIGLQAGSNDISVILALGAKHPPQAQLRVFTTDAADYTLTGIQVICLQALPKISLALWIGVGACFFVLVATLAFAWWKMARSQKQGM